MLISIRGKDPQIAPDAFVADTARLIGEVILHARTSIWYGAVLRADLNKIEIGEGTNIQDGAILHVEDDKPCLVGKEVVVGHAAVLHGCTVEDGALIGIGAKVLTGATVGGGALVAAGALVPEGARVEPGALVMGAPAKVKRMLSTEERERILGLARKYQRVAQEYLGVTEHLF
jgi:carbonic anhydrase/acetyltransferase-like protein (isoleucine patch superfamily)